MRERVDAIARGGATALARRRAAPTRAARKRRKAYARVARTLIPPMLGGAMLGWLAIASPLIVGDGASQLPKIIKNGVCLLRWF